MNRKRSFWLWIQVSVLAALVSFCAPEKTGGGAGDPCVTSEDCDVAAKLECRAKKCRTVLEKKPPTARISITPDSPESGQVVELNGQNSKDPQDDPLRYAWSLTAKPEKSKATLAKAKEAIASFTPDVAGKYTVKLVVSTGEGKDERSGEQTQTLTVVERPNAAPIADAGPDQLLEPNSKVQLDGSASSDPDSDKLTYAWTLKSMPDGSLAKLSDPAAQKPTFTGELEGSYVLELVVTDERGATSAPDSVTIRIAEGALQTPKLTSITPSEGVAYELKKKVVLKGEHFYKGARIQIGSKEFPTTLKSQQELEAEIDLALIGEGSHPVVVINVNNKTSKEDVKFTIKGVPPPKLTSLTPPRGHIGSSIKVKAIGENFIVGRSEVLFKSVPLKTTVLSPTELEFELDLKNTPVGTYPVKINNPGNRASQELQFEVLDKLPKPVLRVLNPPSSPTDAKLAFSVHGQGFAPGAVIVFDGKQLKSNRPRSDEIQAVPELDLTGIKSGEYDVWVLNPDGQISNKEKFRVRDKDPSPVLNRMLPFTLYLDQVMKDVAVYGQDFQKGAKLYIDGKEITGALGNVVFRSDTFLLAEINLTDKSKWSAGNVDAVVENPNGKKSPPFKVTVSHLVPSVTSLVPSSWTNKCDTDVEVHGTNFVKQVKVKLGSNLVFAVGDKTNPLTYVSDKLLRFRLNATKLGVSTFKVVVENGPQATTTAPDFAIGSGASLTPHPQYVRPAFGKADTQVAVSVRPDSSFTGGYQSFKPGAVVMLNGVKQKTACASFSTNYCYELTATLDLNGVKPGDYDLHVVNPCGVQSVAMTFTVEAAPEPYISGINPAFVRVGDKTKITLTGANFAKTHTLTLGGKVLKTTHKSDTEIETVDPVDFSTAAVGDLDLQVKNGNGQASDVLKFSVIGKYVPTITSVSPNVSQRGGVLPKISVKGDGFVLTSVVYFNGKAVASKLLSTKELQITSIDATNLNAGSYQIQVKNGSRASNIFPLQLTPAPSPRIDYTNPSSVVAGTKSTLTLYVYGSNFSQQPDSKLIFKDPDGKDITKGRWTPAYVYTTYMRGTLNVAGLSQGKYELYVENPTKELSNKIVFRIAPPPPPIATSISPSTAFRGSSTQRVQILGSNFVNGDLIIFNNDVLNRIPGTASTSTTLEGVLNLSKIHYGGIYELYVLRCLDTGCTKTQKTATVKLNVQNPPCSLVNCAKDLPNVEKCDTASNVCRPPCSTTANCTTLDSKASWTCQSGVCK